MNENNKDGSKCADCRRVYGHLTGCKVQGLHEELDRAISTSGVKSVIIFGGAVLTT